MKRLLNRQETELKNLMLKKLSTELKAKMEAAGCDIMVNWETGEFDVTGCPDALKSEILAVLKKP